MGDLPEVEHRRRLAQILRYIANMHLQDDASASFVRPATTPNARDFFQGDNDDLLFTTQSFRQLLRLQKEYPPQDGSAPFQFYAAQESPSAKGMFTGAFQRNTTTSANEEKSCWLRMTRSSLPSPPVPQHPALHQYLTQWLSQTRSVTTLDSLLTLQRMEKAPRISAGVSRQGQRHIQHFLQQYQHYLHRRAYHRIIEPIYNTLFEWVHGGTDHQLVWGLGHAKVIKDGVLTSGPVLEILVEVEMARDGALLIRPREHTGVSLNRQVMTCFGVDNLQEIYKNVAELNPSQLSPAQPNTYLPILKQIAVHLRGNVVKSTDTRSFEDLCISEAWCLYTRAKPSSVWARDALALADAKLELPLAVWSLTHGPAAMEKAWQREMDGKDPSGRWKNQWWAQPLRSVKDKPKKQRPTILALPASDAQNRIADLLLHKNKPVVVCEGPPGTGKTQTIANIICAYLCEGKRVLVTSKNAPALSVLRNRLPEAVREVCVDVSMSELVGMRQLQQTVERLANKVASCNSDLERERYHFYRNTIEEHQTELLELDRKICDVSERIRKAVNSGDGQQYVQLSTWLWRTCPWLMNSLTKSSPKEVEVLYDQTEKLVLDDNNPVLKVHGLPPNRSRALVALCESKAGLQLSTLSTAARKSFAALPVVGPMLTESPDVLEGALEEIRIEGHPPVTKSDWMVVVKAMRYDEAMNKFRLGVWQDCWPSFNGENVKQLREYLATALEVKTIAWKLGIAELTSLSADCRSFDARRSILASRIQSLSVELVNATVVSKLSDSFPVEAQSALIRFAQIAGKARFSKSSQPCRMSQRQRRKRQEYLDSFEKCCRFIPCWILTSSQISDYLPAENLFDLVIIDESSQSDVTVLPGMLRGKQWLVVGDGKQVSPTESFISEDQIDSLRASLPSCPLEDSLLPGQSFFDLCAQAFPNGRVVLNEHFRCASEIISFSNDQFYDQALVPLRLPTKSERITPSLLDVYLPKAVKRGRINELEADKIVEMIGEIVSQQPDNPRSIGVISLMGDEQSRLIRGRLLNSDRVGPGGMVRHDILVGDPPAFQGAERDVIFLSMVCSANNTPTQNQLFHFQRANVALSRARDQMVLVRSLNVGEIPNPDDAKIPIIEFFRMADLSKTGEPIEATPTPADERIDTSMARTSGVSLLKCLLEERGYSVLPMGVVWKGGLCVENQPSDSRAAIMLDCVEEARQDWHTNYLQQKAIERVGWTCLRIDVFTFLHDTKKTMDWVEKFLFAAGVQPAFKICDELEDDIQEVEDGKSSNATQAREDEVVVDIDAVVALTQERQHAARRAADPADTNRAGTEDGVILISSDEEATKFATMPDPVPSDFRATFDTGHEQLDPSNFGYVVDLDFLRCGDESSLTGDMSMLIDDDSKPASNESPRVSRRQGKRKSQQTVNDESDAEHSMEAKKTAKDDDWTADDGEDTVNSAKTTRLQVKRQKQRQITADEGREASSQDAHRTVEG